MPLDTGIVAVAIPLVLPQVLVQAGGELASEDVVYVVNRSREDRTDGVRVTVCTHDEEYINEFGSSGEGDGQFIWPTAIALDGEENVYVADEWLNRITVFNKDGGFIRKWGRAGSGNGELNGPSGLAISDGTVFLVDSRNHRVQRLALDGKYLGQFGNFGDGPGQLNTPWGIGLDRDGNVFVADWRNDRIQSFTPDGKWLASFGQPSSGGDAPYPPPSTTRTMRRSRASPNCPASSSRWWSPTVPTKATPRMRPTRKSTTVDEISPDGPPCKTGRDTA